ncbi:MAG: hypothetical protein ACKER6_01075 [Candidatus Hodgkinia cicadicola]
MVVRMNMLRACVLFFWAALVRFVFFRLGIRMPKRLAKSLDGADKLLNESDAC